MSKRANEIAAKTAAAPAARAACPAVSPPPAKTTPARVSKQNSDSQDSVFIRSITPRNILSFGDDCGEIKLRPLNVLIGPNASGKSNFLDLIALIRSTGTGNTASVIGDGGGVFEWVWKGKPQSIASLTWQNELNVAQTLEFSNTPPFHFSQEKYKDEKIDFSVNGSPIMVNGKTIGPGFELNGKRFKLSEERVESNGTRKSSFWGFQASASFLSQIESFPTMEASPAMRRSKQKYRDIRIYRDWETGRKSALRNLQGTDGRIDSLEEDFSNLFLFLNNMKAVSPKIAEELVLHLGDLYEGAENFEVHMNSNSLQLRLHEEEFSIPAVRLSDGTLRYLCLLAILCDPNPPPLICIEEPEMGLHPDAIVKLARLLEDAATRTQLIVTTHSTVLVDAMSDNPESIVVCEKNNGKTTFNRLDAKEMESWLERYSLGELWTRGEIGGNRW